MPGPRAAAAPAVPAVQAPRFHSEPSDEPLLLRFVETPGGPRPVYGEEDPPPAECVGSFIAQALEERGRSAAERQGGDGGESGEQRAQVLREAQQVALESLQRAGKVSELLQRTTWGREQIRFLSLHPAVGGRPPPDGAARAPEERGPAIPPWCPAQMREAGASVAGSAEHTEREGVLRFLRRHWTLHHIDGNYAAELWEDRPRAPGAEAARGGRKRPKPEPPQPYAGKHLAFITQHPELGVCVAFPREFGQLVEWRHRLLVRAHPLGAAEEQEGGLYCAPPRGAAPRGPDAGLADPVAPRGRAIHLALLEAQEALVDRSAFQHFRECLLRGDASGCRWRWHVLRVSSTEVAVVLPVGAAGELIHVVVSYGVETAPGPGGGGHGLWDWLADLGRVRLQELFLARAAPAPGGPPAEDAGDGPAGNLFDDFMLWAEPQIEAVVRHLAGGGHGH